MSMFRLHIVSLGLFLALLGVACDESEPVDTGDTGADADAALDTGVDTTPGEDTAVDTTPPGPVGFCLACDADTPCAAGLVCGQSLCLETCELAAPDCPVGFTCATVDADALCVPDATCCVDEDEDGYGDGACLDVDCDDTDGAANPGAAEACNGVDDDCDGTTDGASAVCPATCEPSGQGFRATSGATCQSGQCSGGAGSNCGLFACDGGQTGTACATGCAPDGTDDDDFCASGAHCDAGVCVAGLPNGSACVDNRWCASSWCESELCCTTGRCCNTVDDCPAPSAPTCDEAATCQGTRSGWACTSNQCILLNKNLEDDSACDAQVEAVSCAPFGPALCTGELEQTTPPCPTACEADVDCALTASCHQGVCVAGKGPGTVCTTSATCRSGLQCADGVCCDSSCTCGNCNKPGTRGTCIPDANGTTCRAAANSCDVAETCNGTLKVCPDNAFASIGTACTDGFCNTGGVCDASCVPGVPCTTARGCEVGVVDCSTGAPVCQPTGAAVADTVCRAAADLCDLAETCDGTSLDCPADELATAGTVCNASTGLCDAAETCDGSSVTCPADELEPVGTVCRVAADLCDVEETCDGTDAACPGDLLAGAGTECRASTDAACDPAETCDGLVVTCPQDETATDDTDCDDGTYCNGVATCQAGVCTPGAPCVDPNADDCADVTCDETGRACNQATRADDVACGAVVSATGFCWSGTCYDCGSTCAPHDCEVGGVPGCTPAACAACPAVTWP